MKNKQQRKIITNSQTRKTQSANKSRFDESPSPVYRNYTHKYAKNPKLIAFNSNNYTKFIDQQSYAQGFLQQSIDVNQFSRNKKSVSSHVRVKTDQDRLPNFNKRYYPNEMKQLLNIIDDQRQNTINQPYIQMSSIVNHQKSIDKNKLVNQIQIYKINLENLDKNSKIDFQVLINQKLEINYSESSKQQNPICKGVTNFDISGSHQQSQSEDISPILRGSYFLKINNLCNQDLQSKSREEDPMQFSFGMQQNRMQLKEINRKYQKFPKDIFLGDVRKVKRINNSFNGQSNYIN